VLFAHQLAKLRAVTNVYFGTVLANIPGKKRLERLEANGWSFLIENPTTIWTTLWNFRKGYRREELIIPLVPTVFAN